VILTSSGRTAKAAAVAPGPVRRVGGSAKGGQRTDRWSRLAFRILVTVWGAWFLYSYVLIADQKPAFIALYTCYLLLGAAALVRARKDLLSPTGLITFIFFQSFGLSIPLLAASTGRPTSDILIDDRTLVSVMTIVLVAYAAFAAGAEINANRVLRIDRTLRRGGVSRRVSVLSFVLLGAVVLGAGAVRIAFHLGEAGIQPTIPYSGYFQYVLFDGVKLACLWYLAQGLRQGAAYSFLGLLLLVGIAWTQVLLGWRGGIVHVLIVVFIVFWYHLLVVRKTSVTLLVWAVAVAMLIPVFVQAGNAVRASRLGGEQEYAVSASDFLDKVLMRGQGTTRLAAVVQLVGPLTWTNDFKIRELQKQGLSTTEYVDQQYFLVDPTASNSFGTSGPGGVYLAMGIFGVISAYGLLGMLYRVAYEYMRSSIGRNPLAVAWYATMAHALFGAASENLNLGTAKLLLSLTAFLVLFSLLLLRRGPATARA
jgi:hypothetical protein